jgi:hypothetical protein
VERHPATLLGGLEDPDVPEPAPQALDALSHTGVLVGPCIGMSCLDEKVASTSA